MAKNIDEQIAAEQEALDAVRAEQAAAANAERVRLIQAGKEDALAKLQAERAELEGIAPPVVTAKSEVVEDDDTIDGVPAWGAESKE